MPLAVEDYQQDFTDQASVAEFLSLQAAAERTFVVPCPDNEPHTRPLCYARLGRYVARHCHVLLALWNGRTNDKVGGTSQTVRYRLDGMAPEIAERAGLFDSIDNGIVYQIVTPRRSDPCVEGAAFELHVLKPETRRRAVANGLVRHDVPWH